MVYQWKWRLPVPAQAAGEHLEDLERKHGQLTPKIVLDDSRAEDALLHPCFEWDDERAAELYREKQACFILRNLTVQVEREDKPPQPVRAFVSVTREESRSFIGISKALSEQETRDQVLREAMRSLQSFREKYRGLAELGGVLSAIDAFGEAVKNETGGRIV